LGRVIWREVDGVDVSRGFDAGGQWVEFALTIGGHELLRRRVTPVTASSLARGHEERLLDGSCEENYAWYDYTTCRVPGGRHSDQHRPAFLRRRQGGQEYTFYLMTDFLYSLLLQGLDQDGPFG
jgi:hypothetical protein